MHQEIITDLPKLGNRPYIQGGTIFNAIADAADDLCGPSWWVNARVSSFKLQVESTGNGRIVLADEPLHDLVANASFIAARPDRKLFAYYVDEGRPTRREDYDEESYYRIARLGGGFDGEFIFPGGRPRVDFMCAVVGANKRVHQAATGFGAPLAHIQFLYLRDLEGVCLGRSSEELRVQIDNSSVQDRQSEVWTINRVAVRGASFVSEFRIGYRGVRPTA